MEAAIERFDLALADPLETAAGTIERRRGFLLFIGRGPVGVGEATPLPGWTERIPACRDALAAAMDHLGGDDVDAAFDAVDDAPAARHALALALLDRAARRDGDPLYRSLGGEDRVDSVRVNATIGAGDVAATTRAADAAVHQGYGCVKVKVGVGRVDADVTRLAAVREDHPDLGIRADANGAWDRDIALDAIEGFAPLDVEYVEQPLAADDLAGHASLRGRGVGIALDETLAGLDVDTVLDADAADVVVCKPMVLGGVDRTRDAACRARRAGVTPVVTTTVDAVVARTAAVHLAASLDDVSACGLATAGRLAEDLAPDPAPVNDGVITVPQAPGLGVDTA